MEPFLKIMGSIMIDHIGQMPFVAAKKFKNKEALCFEGQSFTFEELSKIIEKFSS